MKLPFGDAPLPEGLKGTVGSESREVIAGMRPEHFEDAEVGDRARHPGHEVQGQGRGGGVDGL